MSAGRPLKVRMVVTVEVDPAVWADEYGIRPEDARADVRSYFADLLHNAPAVDYAEARVTVRP